MPLSCKTKQTLHPEDDVARYDFIAKHSFTRKRLERHPVRKAGFRLDYDFFLMELKKNEERVRK